jgi:hypothetical protein
MTHKSCPHCGHWFDASRGDHGCPESKPDPELISRLRDDHTDTIECTHGFNLWNGDQWSGCPNPICLARDLAEAAREIERLRALVPIGIESYAEAVSVVANRSNGSTSMPILPADDKGVPIPNAGKGGRFWVEGEWEIQELEALVTIGKHRLNLGETG